MKHFPFFRRTGVIPVLLSIGFSFLLSFCQHKETDYASLYDQVTSDTLFRKYISTSDEIGVLIASDKFGFPPDVKSSEVSHALQNAGDNKERVVYLKRIGCSGDVETFIRLQSENIDCKAAVMKNHPEAKPSELLQICTDYRNKQENKPDIVNIAKTALDEKTSKK